MFSRTKKPHTRRIAGHSETRKKPLWERMHEWNLSRTFWIILLGLVLLLVSTIIFAWFVDDHVPWVAKSDSNARNNWYFIFSALISIYSAYFTLSAYWIARKVEEYVRTPIRDYADFIEQARIVLETGRPEFKIMTYYPYFSIDEYVANKGGMVIDSLLGEILSSSNKSVELYILNETERTTFLDDMKSKVNVSARHIQTVKAHFDELQDDFKNDVLANKTREHRDGKFPIQMFWSSTIMTFVANPKDYPNKNLKCSGFTSRDPDILEAFKMIFDDYYNNQCLSDPLEATAGASETIRSKQDTEATTQDDPVSEESSSQKNMSTPATNEQVKTPMSGKSESADRSGTNAKAVSAGSQVTSPQIGGSNNKGTGVRDMGSDDTVGTNDSNATSTDKNIGNNKIEDG